MSTGHCIAGHAQCPRGIKTKLRVRPGKLILPTELMLAGESLRWGLPCCPATGAVTPAPRGGCSHSAVRGAPAVMRNWVCSGARSAAAGRDRGDEAAADPSACCRRAAHAVRGAT